jgi:hypothetical protein
MVERNGTIPYFGAPEVSRMLPGDHAYLAYGTAADRRSALHAYLKAGIDAGQRVAYLSGELPDDSEDWLCAGDAALHRCVASGQLLLVGAGAAVYGGPSGGPRVDPDRTMTCLQVMADEARTDGYPALRLAAEGSYLTEGLEPERIVAFERELNRLVEANRMLALCVYPVAGRHDAPG